MASGSNLSLWVRAFLYGLLAEILAFVVAMLVIAGFAMYLGFKARGAPDQALIGRFAEASAPWITAVVGILLTFVLARWVARKAGHQAVKFALVVGFSAGLFDVIAAVVFRSSFSLRTMVVVVLLVLGTWAGGRLGGRRSAAQTIA
jgi:uncharacterized membrane protein